MSLARKLARRDVIPESVKREWYERGCRAGVESVRQQTREQLSTMYDQGFTAGMVKSHCRLPLCAVAVLHDKFGFGKARAQRFADELNKLTEEVAEGYVSEPELMQMLVDDGLDCCSRIVVEDKDGKRYGLDLERAKQIEKSNLQESQE